MIHNFVHAQVFDLSDVYTAFAVGVVLGLGLGIALLKPQKLR